MTSTARSARNDLLERLRARRVEIEEAILARVFAVDDPTTVIDPEYVGGLRGAVRAAVDYGLSAIELGDDRAPSLPPALRAQARLAARNGVSLDTVLRRYFAGQAVIADVVVEEAERSGPRAAAQLQCLLRAQASVFDRLIAAVTEEHSREDDARSGSPRERRAERIKRLLAGERLDTAELGYDFDAHHLGAIAKGGGAADALRELAGSLDRRLLCLSHDDDTGWAWFGGRVAIDREDLEPLIAASWPPRVCLAIGEPAQGPGGWRLTHRQARAALPIALRSPEAFVRYADVALLASILQDDLLTISLREMYLKPLEGRRDGGEALRETLRAYFACGRNVSSAAARLGVSRQAVNSRLRALEQTLGCSFESCATELEMTLRIEDLATPEHLAIAPSRLAPGPFPLYT